MSIAFVKQYGFGYLTKIESMEKGTSKYDHCMLPYMTIKTNVVLEVSDSLKPNLLKRVL